MVKKILMTLVMSVCLILPGWADSYTIEFKSNPKDATNDLTSSNFAAQIESGANFVEFKECSKCYQGINGLKFSSSKANGSLTMTLTPDAQVVPSSIVLKAVKYGSDKSEVSVNGADAQVLDGSELSDYTFDFNTTEPITELVINATKRIYLKSITVNYSAGSSDLKPADLSFGEQTTFSVDFGQEFTAPELINPNGLAVTYSSDNEEVATVDAATGTVTIKSYGNVRITAESEESAEFKAGKASYSLSVVAIANSISEIYAYGADGSTQVRVNFPLYVTYRNGINCYVVSEDNQPSLIYGTTEYQRGDMIPAGWVSTYDLFNGLPEIKPVGAMPAPAGQVEIEYPSVPAAEITEENVNGIFYLEGITFEAATPTTADASKNRNFVGKDAEGNELMFRANFSGVPSVEPGTYNVMVAVSYYKNGNTEGTLQFYPISYDQRTVPEIRFGDVGVVAGDDLFEMSEVAVSEGINPDEIGFIFYDTNFVQIESLRPNIYFQDGKWYVQPNNTCGVFYVLVAFAGNEQYLPMTTDFVIAVYPNIDYVKVAINGAPVVEGETNEITGEETADLTFEAPEGYTVYYRVLTGEAQEGDFIKYENGSNVTIEGNGKVEYKAEAAGCESETRIVAYSISTAVEMIEAADGNTEIYTLDGVRVNSGDIEDGLYILIRDGKATKIRVVR